MGKRKPIRRMWGDLVVAELEKRGIAAEVDFVALNSVARVAVFPDEGPGSMVTVPMYGKDYIAPEALAERMAAKIKGAA